MAKKAETVNMEKRNLGCIEEMQKRRKPQKQKKPANLRRLCRILHISEMMFLVVPDVPFSISNAAVFQGIRFP